MRWKTRVVCQGCAILKPSSETKSQKQLRAALIASWSTLTRNRNGKSGSLPTSYGYGTSHLRLYWSPLRTNCNNARAILEDYRQIGSEVWSRFKRGRKQQLWYFGELIKVHEERCPNWRIVKELQRTVAELDQISATDRISAPGQT